jgi:enterochelin esterase family protein
MRRLLEERGYEITYREFPGGHEFLWWQETLAWGLLALLGE